MLYSEYLFPPLPTVSEMQHWDQEAVNFGIPDTMLMENASRSAVSLLERLTGPVKDKNILVFMGGGNNGGDAVCMARILHDHGAHVLIAHTKKLTDLKGAALFHTNLAIRDKVPFYELDPQKFDELLNFLHKNKFIPSIAVDGLIGVALHGELSDNLIALIQAINLYIAECHAFMFAIDLPSGLNADTGWPMPCAIQAQATGCMAFAKSGLALPRAKKYTGELYICDIGMPRSQPERCSATRLLDGRVLLAPKNLPQNSYKNIYGHVLVIGGQAGTTGAAHLSALSALRSGAGLVTVSAPETSIYAVKANQAEIMTLGAGTGSEWPDEIPASLINLAQHCQSMVIGPGMGREAAAARFLYALLSMSNRPRTVLDADALYLLAQNPDWLNLLSENDVITPHPLEAARLLGCNVETVERDRISAHKALTEKTHTVVVLKGVGTLIGHAKSPAFLCPYDIPQLAVGGSGDVLSGAIGAALAAKDNSSDILLPTAMAVMRHIIAGMILAKDYPSRGCLAGEIADALSHAEQFTDSLDNTSLYMGLTPWPK